jgi:hypothetical protein
MMLAACTPSPPTPSNQASTPAQSTSKTIQIISDPPGARIEVNQDYVGDAPLSISVPEKDGNFTKETIIQATPTQQGQYVQSKWFSNGEAIPSRLLFSTGLGPG